MGNNGNIEHDTRFNHAERTTSSTNRFFFPFEWDEWKKAPPPRFLRQVVFVCGQKRHGACDRIGAVADSCSAYKIERNWGRSTNGWLVVVDELLIVRFIAFNGKKSETLLKLNNTTEENQTRTRTHTHAHYEYCDIDLTGRLYRSWGFSCSSHQIDTLWLWHWRRMSQRQHESQSASLLTTRWRFVTLCGLVCDVHTKRSISHFVIIITSCLRNVYFNKAHFLPPQCTDTLRVSAFWLRAQWSTYTNYISISTLVLMPMHIPVAVYVSYTWWSFFLLWFFCCSQNTTNKRDFIHSFHVNFHI